MGADKDLQDFQSVLQDYHRRNGNWCYSETLLKDNNVDVNTFRSKKLSISARKWFTMPLHIGKMIIKLFFMTTRYLVA